MLDSEDNNLEPDIRDVIITGFMDMNQRKRVL